MPNANKQKIAACINPLLDEIFKGQQDPAKSSVLSEINNKLDKLIDMLSPPKSAVITGPEVERIIKELEKSKGR